MIQPSHILEMRLAAPGCSAVTVGTKTRPQANERIAAVGERCSCEFERVHATGEGAVRA